MTALGNVDLPSGRHAAFRDWDAPSLVCTGRENADVIEHDGPTCPAHEDRAYCMFAAKHRSRVLKFPCCNTTRVVSSPAAAESARALHECEVAS